MALYCSTTKASSKHGLPKKLLPPDLKHDDGAFQHHSSCSYQSPCIVCDDKYSTPDPVFCNGILMGGVRHGICEACLNALKNDGERFQDHMLCSFKNPCIVCDDKYSTPDPLFCQGILMGRMRHGRCAACVRSQSVETIPKAEIKVFVGKENLWFSNSDGRSRMNFDCLRV